MHGVDAELLEWFKAQQKQVPCPSPKMPSKLQEEKVEVTALHLTIYIGLGCLSYDRHQVTGHSAATANPVLPGIRCLGLVTVVGSNAAVLLNLRSSSFQFNVLCRYPHCPKSTRRQKEWM
jgi:hypothetical protein